MVRRKARSYGQFRRQTKFFQLIERGAVSLELDLGETGTG